MKVAIIIAVFISCFVWFVAFWSIDACLDAGGSYDAWGFICSGAEPLYKSASVEFWCLAIAIPALVSALLFKALPSARP